MPRVFSCSWLTYIPNRCSHSLYHTGGDEFLVSRIVRTGSIWSDYMPLPRRQLNSLAPLSAPSQNYILCLVAHSSRCFTIIIASPFHARVAS